MKIQPSLATWQAPDGGLRLYEAYYGPTTDAPRVYHVAAGLAVLATSVEHRVWLPFGGARIYPNMWALILGPSSFFRKSTCISQARRTIGRLHHGAAANEQPLLPDEFSREALLKRLSERAQGLLTYSEFSGALAQFGKDYMSGTKELLADLYDSPESYSRVVGQHTYTLKTVCLSVLAASQTDWFLEKVRSGDLRGGFLARLTYWPAFRKEALLSMPPEPNAQVGNDLINHLNALRGVQGPMELPPRQRERYGKWLESHERELHNAPKAGELSPFWSRLGIVTLKLAMLLELSSTGGRVVSDDSMESALDLTEFLKSSLRWLFEEEFAFTEPMRNRQKILRLVTAHPGIKFRDLLRASSLLKRDAMPVIDTLVAEQSVEFRDNGYWVVSGDRLRADDIKWGHSSASVIDRNADTKGAVFL
jgi:hypothetical protein